MTEQEWLACTRPGPLLRFLAGTSSERKQVSERKLRLFAVGCCRMIWHLFRDKRSRRAVQIAERFADGNATPDTLVAARQSAQAASGLDGGAALMAAYPDAHEAAVYTGSHALGHQFTLTSCSSSRTAWVNAEAESDKKQATLFRCIFGNPFHPLPPKRGRKKWEEEFHTWLAWNRGRLVRLAEQIYKERAFNRLPTLADALEESGCQEAALLAHCRGPGPHVRGCWVVDLLLGTE